MTFEPLQQQIDNFATERDWDQFHLPRSLILALQSELGELAEIVQWTPDSRMDAEWLAEHRDRLSEEMSDVLIYLLRLASVLEIDLETAAIHKIDANAKKYPVEKARGSAQKYTEL